MTVQTSGNTSAAESVSGAAKKTRKSEKTRRKILDAAAYCLNHQGYALISMQTIAEHINIRAASIYYYFDNKDDLVDEVLRIGMEVVFDKVRDAVESLDADATCRERVEAATLAHLTALLDYGDYTSANIRNFSLVPMELRRNNLAVRRAYANFWRELFEHGRQSGEINADVDLTLTRLLLIGGINWSTDWYNPRKLPVEQISKEVCRIFFDGVAAPPTSQDPV
ncbi:TetR/AcrR family transcriptional regulator [Oceanicola sp. 22II-s10i]|uniref:TetR/AcrR family transcriptional regulator n=1 Tax=Oceanicola sp. 22II-s10i TaxID=1317116 RepID=UPI000B5224DC|nr:TetR/AcrR family transcriptional regulator [Oceanicola sp. 22II-s10i]